MIQGIRLKVCGLTSIVDADLALRVGADYLGFVLHPESPRRVTLAQCRAMAVRLPGRMKVAVMVEPSVAGLAEVAHEDFDFFQIHFRIETPAEMLAAWVGAAGHKRVWLAPRLPPDTDVPAELLPFAETFLLDTYHSEKFGGTGLRADWAKIRRHREAHPEKNWILAGGLNPANIGDALTATGARWIDVNSGVEQAPGVKDLRKLQAFVTRLREALGNPKQINR